VKRVCAAFAVWFCATVPALGQDRGQLLPLVGVLRIDTPATLGLTSGLLREALAALGDVDGSTIRLDFRLAEGDAAQFPEMAAALVQDKPSVIVATGEAAARAAQAATHTIPIVASTNDLVASGLIASLAKPGGNITGISLLVTELDAKRLEVLTELVPSGRHFGVLNDPAISQPSGLQALAVTARARGVELLTVSVHAPQELPPALASLRADGAEGVNILSSPLFNSHRDQIGPLLLQHKLPAICEWREMTASGCLASYGTTLREGYAIQAALIDKMLKGARPGDTPAQQPTKFELILNLKVAREIGVEIPPGMLGRADEVIE
jgi:putative tryptophan/tyrosine transport system substrate-binding protein